MTTRISYRTVSGIRRLNGSQLRAALSLEALGFQPSAFSRVRLSSYDFYIVIARLICPVDNDSVAPDELSIQSMPANFRSHRASFVHKYYTCSIVYDILTYPAILKQGRRVVLGTDTQVGARMYTVERRSWDSLLKATVQERIRAVAGAVKQNSCRSASCGDERH